MPQITNEETLREHNVAPQADNKTVLERLMDLFGPYEWVRVKNIDTEAYMWQWMNPQKEQIVQVGSKYGPQTETYREAPELWKIEAGESEPLVGANAYIMIEGLVKKMQAKRAMDRAMAKPEYKPGQEVNFNYTDPITQEEFISKIYLGKERIRFGGVSKEEQQQSQTQSPIRNGLEGVPTAATYHENPQPQGMPAQ